MAQKIPSSSTFHILEKTSIFSTDTLLPKSLYSLFFSFFSLKIFTKNKIWVFQPFPFFLRKNSIVWDFFQKTSKFSIEIKTFPIFLAFSELSELLTKVNTLTFGPQSFCTYFVDIFQLNKRYFNKSLYSCEKIDNSFFWHFSTEAS